MASKTVSTCDICGKQLDPANNDYISDQTEIKLEEDIRGGQSKYGHTRQWIELRIKPTFRDVYKNPPTCKGVSHNRTRDADLCEQCLYGLLNQGPQALTWDRGGDEDDEDEEDEEYEEEIAWDEEEVEDEDEANSPGPSSKRKAPLTKPWHYGLTK